MPRRATHCAVLCVLALWPLSACGGNGGQGTTDRPSVTTSLSPTRTLPSPTRSPDAPRADGIRAEPVTVTGSVAGRDHGSPDTTRRRNDRAAPTASTTREPKSKSPRATARTTTVTAAPVPEATHSAPSPSPSPVAGAGQPSEDAGHGVADEMAPSRASGRGRRDRDVARASKRASGGAGSPVWRPPRQKWHGSRASSSRSCARPGRRTRSSEGGASRMPRAAAAEDQLTVLSSSARNREDAARALQLRDAVRSASRETRGAVRTGRARPVGAGPR